MCTTSANALNPTSSSNPAIVDDKSPHCIPFILSLLKERKVDDASTKPFIIGLNGVQGAGKTTLVSTLSSLLFSSPYSLNTLVLSIDDLYLPHAQQKELAETNKENPLVQHRGEPGTHDIALAAEVFGKLSRGEEVKIPEYDKSAYNGEGDRIPVEKWKVVNKEGEEKIKVVIFEGWCVGFRSLPEERIRERQKEPSKTLAGHRTEVLLFVNEKLNGYEVLNGSFDAFIHIDAEDTGYVYAWRQEQEAALRREKGSGMTEEQVERFVDGYFPAYELYTDALREGVFKGKEGGEGRQLRLVVGRDRRVREVFRI